MRISLPWGLSWKAIGRAIICVCLAYIMIRPVGFNSILIPVIGVLAITSGLLAWSVRGRFSKTVLLVLALTLITGLYGTVIGIGNPGLFNGMLVWIIAPIIYGLLVLAGDERLVQLILRVSVYVTIVVSAGIILYVAGAVGFTPQLIPHFVQQQVGAGFDSDAGGTTNITFYGLSTLVAAAPLWLTAAILPHSPLLPHKALSVIAAVFAAGATLLAGRAAITILLISVPLVTWIIWRIVTRRERRSLWRAWAPLVAAVAAVAAVVLLDLAGNTSIQRSIDRVITVFSGQGQSLDDRIRSIEAVKLLGAWTNSPIFGHGLGATIPGYSRNHERPWNFELQYHLILFQTGLIGALLMVAALGIAVYGLTRVIRRRPDLLPVLLVTASGAAALLIANSINPYLQAPGNMWPVYLALMAINVGLVRKYEQTHSDVEVVGSHEQSD
ncbi:hypothetical protein [Leifsonia sp. Root112D2]|uniref:hypothetical protein n=1 Tax=Leifsonia sp. Root112D2 TaxID=1736426 RepID=UPI0012FB6ADF|nr:hypothetical protein [Leifsonia sp. Root112D2]